MLQGEEKFHVFVGGECHEQLVALGPSAGGSRTRFSLAKCRLSLWHVQGEGQCACAVRFRLHGHQLLLAGADGKYHHACQHEKIYVMVLLVHRFFFYRYLMVMDFQVYPAQELLPSVAG